MLKFIKHYWDKVLLLFFITTYVVVFSYLSIARHNAFASGFDLANQDQTIWNSIYGKFFSLSAYNRTISRFSIHADLILIFLSPIYMIWNNVRMLLFTQSFFLAIGAIPVYLLSQKVLKNKFISLCLVLIYLINPGLQWINIYDFHGIALVIPFLLFSFYFAYIKKWRWYIICAVLALLTKEQVSLILSLLGLFILFIFKERKIGAITFFVGIIWFLLMVFLVIPHFNPENKHWALSWYQFGEEENTISSLIPKPKTIVDKFLYANDIKSYYISLLKPFSFLPIIGFPWILLALPQLAINVMSSHGQMRSIVFHYASGIIPWLIISTIFSIYYLKLLINKIIFISKFSLYIITLIVVGAVLVGLRVNYHYSPLPTTPSCWCLSYKVTQDDIEFEKLLQEIPKNASITSSPEIRPHLTHRLNSYTLSDATSSADFIALIDQNRMVGNYDPKDFELRLRDQLKTSKDYTFLKHIGHFYLYKRIDYEYQ